MHGYRTSQAEPGEGFDRERSLLFWYLTLVVVLLLLSLVETRRQVSMYGAVVSETGVGLLHALLVVAAGVGFGWRWRRRAEYSAARGLLLGLSFVSSVGAGSVLFSMPEARLTFALLVGFGALQACLASAALAEHVRWYASASLELGIVSSWAQPLRSLALLSAATFALLLSDRTGVTLFPIVLGAAAWVASLFTDQIDTSLQQGRATRRHFSWFDACHFAVLAVALMLVTKQVPAVFKASYGADILYLDGDHNSQRLVLVGRDRGLNLEALGLFDAGHHVDAASAGGAELFVDERLHFGPIDGQRYSRALVRPVFERRTADTGRRSGPRSVLVLGTGSGVVEQQVLRHSVERVMVIAPSENVHELTRKSPWLRDAVGHWHDDARVQFEVDDGVRWLQRNDERFDAIVVDAPPPTSVRAGLFYTTYFLRLLAAHSNEGATLVMPGLSPLNTEQASLRLRQSAEAAGFDVKLEEAPLVGAGDWAVLVLIPAPARAHRDTSTLQNLAVTESFTREYMEAMGIY